MDRCHGLGIDGAGEANGDGRRRDAHQRLATAIDALRKAGAKQLFLEVDEANEAARSLYQSLGAVAVGRRPRYYEHGADADIFSLAL